MTTSSPRPHFAGDELKVSNDRLDRALTVSVVAHVVVIAAFTLRAVLYPSANIPVENSIRVDIVSLPDKPQAKLAPLPAPAEPEKVVAPKEVAPELPKPPAPTVNLEKNKSDQSAALKRLAALEKLKAMSTEPNPENIVKKTSPEPPQVQPQQQAQIVKGNEVSRGNALSGIAKLNHENYSESVHQHVRKYWNLPQWMTNAKLIAKVQLFIDARGNVVKKVMTRSSNQSVFDERVMRAIESATPMPRPPNDLVNILAVDGIEIEFAPEG